MLTPEQIDEFQRFGILRVPGAISRRGAEAMCDSVWDDARPPLPHSTRRSRNLDGAKNRGHQRSPASITFEQLANSDIRAMFDQLLGPAGWERDRSLGLAAGLVSGHISRSTRWRGTCRIRVGISMRRWCDRCHISTECGCSPVWRKWRLKAARRSRSPGRLGSRTRWPTRVVARSCDPRTIRKGLMQRYVWMKELCSFDASARSRSALHGHQHDA